MPRWIPSRDFGFQIDWSGKRLCKLKELRENDISRIGSIHFDDENGFCVFCRPCNTYMDCYGEDFECPECGKQFTDERLLRYFNKKPYQTMDDLIDASIGDF